jgi:hypothetical protein
MPHFEFFDKRPGVRARRNAKSLDGRRRCGGSEKKGTGRPIRRPATRPGEWEYKSEEKKDFEEDTGDEGQHYGHRDDDNVDEDKYLPDRKTGCKYSMRDRPGSTNLIAAQEILKEAKKIGHDVKVEFQIKLSFRLHIKDVCTFPGAKPCDQKAVLPSRNSMSIVKVS